MDGAQVPGLGVEWRRVLSRERIAKLPRYCRNYAHETQKCPAKDGGARIICAMDGAYNPVSSSIETLKA